MAYQQNFYLDKNTDFEVDIEVFDENSNTFNFTGYSAFGQIKKSWQSVNKIDMIVTLSTGNINLQVNSAATANFSPGKYMYDVCIIENSSSKITKVVEGSITINPTISSK